MAVLFSLAAQASGGGRPPDDAIVISHESGFGLSLGGHSSGLQMHESRDTSYPISTPAEQGVLEYKSGLSFDVKTNDKATKGKIVVNLPQVRVWDLSDWHNEVFIWFDDSAVGFDRRIEMLSAFCVGDAVVQLDTYQGNVGHLQRMTKDTNVEASSSSIIATGQAAVIFGSAGNGRTRSRSNDDEIQEHSHLRQAFVQRVAGLGDREWTREIHTQVRAPSILLQSSMHAGGSSIVGGMSTVNRESLACKPEFKALMKDFSVEALATSTPEHSKIKWEASKPRVTIEWKDEN